MNILVIKQTSLGDVLHSTAAVRALRKKFPACHLTVLTAAGSADIYRHNPNVNELILWHRGGENATRNFKDALRQVRARRYDLAFDLQGLARSAIFLYAARARRKFIKGHWLGLRGFRNRELHALDEIAGVLALAGVEMNDDAALEIFTDDTAKRAVDELLAEINPHGKPLLIFSPFSRWASKDWRLNNYVDVAARIASDGNATVIFTGADNARAQIDAALQNIKGTVNLAGKLPIPQFAELVRRATLMLSGDSFPMHVACAQQTPVLALFAPTFESRTGPVGAQHQVIRAPQCTPCDRANCPRGCLDRITVDAVVDALRAKLN